jgi:UDP:flavonoid glycosyltransferase YjiC (YdhE family)
VENKTIPDPAQSNSGSGSFDIIVLADLARESDIGLRIRRELQHFAGLGYRCGLRHLPRSGKPILPDIQRCVREGLAEPIAANADVTAQLAIVHAPGLLKEPVAGLNGMRADTVLMIVDRAPKPEQMGHWFCFNFGNMRWVPTNRWVRGKLEEYEFPIGVEAEDWRSIGKPCRGRPDASPMRERPVVGRVSASGVAQWPKTKTEMAALYPQNAPFDFWVLGTVPEELRKMHAPTKKWTVLSAEDIGVERFIEALDVFMYFPSAQTPELPEAAIATAMASGKVVVLPPNLRTHFGPGALYTEPSDAIVKLTALLEDDVALAELRANARKYCDLLFSDRPISSKLERWVQPALAAVTAPLMSKARKTALFVPSNGIGLGHATRLLAVARRLDDAVEPVFACLGQASSIVEAFGYTSEYIPSYTDIGASVADWDDWFRFELEDIIARHQPDIVVYDGNNPTPGLVNAVLAHGDSRMIWMRRGMCPTRPSPYLDNAKFFDCVFEPGEYAAERDVGATAALKNQVVVLPPVRLLEPEELLTKAEAIEQLGLDANRPAVLLQLGAGGNRDVVDLTDRLINHLRRFETLQIVIAEWSNGAMRLPRWPDTKLLRAFPISRYFNAFDFSISAAGYNTYHEVLGFGLPTIFVANRHPSMDDQGARAEFAQEHSAGFDLTEEEMHLLTPLCEAMLNPQANAFLRQNCASFDRSNGAFQAAEIIKKMIGVA